MKIYARILGILSGIIVIAIIGLLIYILLFESGSSSDKIIGLSLFLPAYILLHFLIIHRFGFNINIEFNLNQRRAILLISIISFGFLFTIPLRELINANKIVKEERALEEMKDWGIDTTAYDFYGHLKTKYVDRKLFYLLKINSMKPSKSYEVRLIEELIKAGGTDKEISAIFKAYRAGTKINASKFTIQLLDADGFLIEEVSITDYSNLVDKKEGVVGIQSNANAYFEISDYKRIRNWNLLVQ